MLSMSARRHSRSAKYDLCRCAIQSPATTQNAASQHVYTTICSNITRNRGYLATTDWQRLHHALLRTLFMQPPVGLEVPRLAAAAGQATHLKNVCSNQTGNHVVEGEVGVVGGEVHGGCSNCHQCSDNVTRGQGSVCDGAALIVQQQPFRDRELQADFPKRTCLHINSFLPCCFVCHCKGGSSISSSSWCLVLLPL